MDATLITGDEANDEDVLVLHVDDESHGYGLSIVRGNVDTHEWDISITESKGGGAQFEITGIRSQEAAA